MKTTLVRLIAAGLCCALLTGCGAAPSTPEAESDKTVLNVPGLFERGDGSVTAVGVLIPVDTANGRGWALVSGPPDKESSTLPPIIAYITNPYEIFYREHSGSLAAMHALVARAAGDSGSPPELKVEQTAFLGPGQGDLRVDRDSALAEPGLYATQAGRLLAVGELTFFDTSTPGERVWALRYPAEDLQQTGVAFVAILANYDELSLGEYSSPRIPLLAVEGLHVEDALNSMGVPRIEVENVLVDGQTP